jgi:hypothetical protein
MAQKLETKKQNEGLLAIGTRRDVLAWRQQVGQFRYLHNDGRISIGEPGMADLGLVVACTITPDMVGKTIGIAVNAEYKTHKTGSRQSTEQKLWQKAFTDRGGVYRVCRSPEDLVKLVDDVSRGQW